MKNILKICLIFLLVFAACKDNSTKYDSFGAQISNEGALASKAMLDAYKGLKMGDTLTIKFSSKINEVCSSKGCWMKLDLTDGNQTMVRFKDYGFFMPLDSKDSEVVVNGKAFITETSVKDLRHYAEDAGKTKEEIEKITESKIEFAFEADGVIIKMEQKDS